MARARGSSIGLPADRIHAWRLERQGLAGHDGSPAASPEDVATRLVGVQAQVLSSAALAIAVRRSTSDPGASVNDTPRAIAERRLVRSWAWRGTLHLFAADDFPTIAAALHHREGWRLPAWLRYFEVTELEMEAVIAAVGETLDDGVPRTRGQLADELERRLGSPMGRRLRSSWGTFLKPAANRGLLIQAGSDGSGVTFVRPDRWLGRWRVEDPDEALRTVISRYLAVYGPASSGELLRWWGGQRAQVVREVLAALGDEVVEVEVDGQRGWLRSEDVPSIEEIDPVGGRRPPLVRLLGGFDPLIVGQGSRASLIPKAFLPRVSRTAGWISPVVLVNGVAAGIWSMARRGKTLALTIEAFEPFGPAVTAAVEREVRHIGALHGLEATWQPGRATPSRPATPSAADGPDGEPR